MILSVFQGVFSFISVLCSVGGGMDRCVSMSGGAFWSITPMQHKWRQKPNLFLCLSMVASILQLLVMSTRKHLCYANETKFHLFHWVLFHKRRRLSPHNLCFSTGKAWNAGIPCANEMRENCVNVPQVWANMTPMDIIWKGVIYKKLLKN